MAKKIKVTGIAEMKKQIKAQKDAMRSNVLAGMLEAAVLVRRDMEKSAPLTPVDLGNLRSSFYITTVLGSKQTGKGYKGEKGKEVAASTELAKIKAETEVKSARRLTLIMGYGANYAIWVHEMFQSRDWNRPFSGPKWFESALKKNKAEMLRLIGKKARIKMIKGFTATRDFPKAHTDIESI